MRKSIVPFLLSAIFSTLCGLQIAVFAASPLTVTVGDFSDQGYCWWCCAESILKMRGIDRPLLREVKRSGNTNASVANIERFVKIDLIPLFRDSVPKTRGGVHVIAVLQFEAGRHAVVMIDVRPGVVVFWNPSEPDGYREMPIAEFSRRWFIGVVIQ